MTQRAHARERVDERRRRRRLPESRLAPARAAKRRARPSSRRAATARSWWSFPSSREVAARCRWPRSPRPSCGSPPRYRCRRRRGRPPGRRGTPLANPAQRLPNGAAATRGEHRLSVLEAARIARRCRPRRPPRAGGDRRAAPAGRPTPGRRRPSPPRPHRACAGNQPARQPLSGSRAARAQPRAGLVVGAGSAVGAVRRPIVAAATNATTSAPSAAARERGRSRIAVTGPVGRGRRRS